MQDLALTPSSGLFDLDLTTASNQGVVAGTDVATSSTLYPALILSLFTRARVRGNGGYWANELGLYPQEPLGSELWSLAQRSVTGTDLLMRDAIERSLSWMVQDSVAQAVEVRVIRRNLDRVDFEVQIFRPPNEVYSVYWDAHRANIGVTYEANAS